MNVFYNPVDLQVMAVYTGTYTGMVWQDLGYVNIELPKGMRAKRDHKLVIVDEKVESLTPAINPIQPQENDKEKLERLAGEADAEIAEATRLLATGNKALAYQQEKVRQESK